MIKRRILSVLKDLFYIFFIKKKELAEKIWLNTSFFGSVVFFPSTRKFNFWLGFDELPVSKVSKRWFEDLRIHILPKENPNARILYKVIKIVGCDVEIAPYNWFWKIEAFRYLKRITDVEALHFILNGTEIAKYSKISKITHTQASAETFPSSLSAPSTSNTSKPGDGLDGLDLKNHLILALAFSKFSKFIKNNVSYEN